METDDTQQQIDKQFMDVVTIFIEHYCTCS